MIPTDTEDANSLFCTWQNSANLIEILVCMLIKPDRGNLKLGIS